VFTLKINATHIETKCGRYDLSALKSEIEGFYPELHTNNLIREEEYKGSFEIRFDGETVDNAWKSSKSFVGLEYQLNNMAVTESEYNNIDICKVYTEQLQDNQDPKDPTNLNNLAKYLYYDSNNKHFLYHENDQEVSGHK
jgi:hypothetical protein